MKLSRKTAFVSTVLFSIAFMGGLLFAQLGELPLALSSLCVALTNLFPIIGMLMVLVAAVVYALGQIMGTETRARANVWATAALGGALMAFLIVAVAPPVLQAIFGGAFNCYGGAPGVGAMCGDTPYDPAAQGCCSGQLIYNLATNQCCPVGEIVICPITAGCCSDGCDYGGGC